MKVLLIASMLFVNSIIAQELHFSKDSLRFDFDPEIWENSLIDTVILNNTGEQELLIDSIYSKYGIGYRLMIQYGDSLYYHFIYDPSDLLNLYIQANDSAIFIFSNPDRCPICKSISDVYFTDSIVVNSNSISSPNSYLYAEGYASASDVSDPLPVREFSLEQNYPNPFNPATIIKYQIPEDGLVTLKIYDILGKEIKILVNEQKATGRYEVRFDASDLATGVYIYRVDVNDFVSVKKMLLIK